MTIHRASLASSVVALAALSSCDRPPRFFAEEIHVEHNGCVVKAMLNEPRGFMSAPRVYAVVGCVVEQGDYLEASLFYTSGQAFRIDAAPSVDLNELDVVITRCGHGYDETPSDVAQQRLEPLVPSLDRARLNVSIRDGVLGCPMDFPSDMNANWRAIE